MHLKRALFATLLGTVLTGLVAGPALAKDTLADVKQRGKLIVGVKADYKPYGYTDPSGKVIGFEPDLAADVAKRLKVELELVPVVAANRMQFVQQGRIDLMIATMSDRKDRREVVGIPDPAYYAAGVNVLAKKDAGLKNWEDIKGKNVCGIQGAFYNKSVQEKYGPNIVAFPGTTEALSALKSGNCVAFVYDDTFFQGKVTDPDWKDYKIAFKSIDPDPWGVGVAKDDEKFKAFMSDTIKDWHKSGFIQNEEKKWSIPPSDFAKSMHDEYGKKK